jgi:hypothetical protein
LAREPRFPPRFDRKIERIILLVCNLPKQLHPLCDVQLACGARPGTFACIGDPNAVLLRHVEKRLSNTALDNFVDPVPGEANPDEGPPPCEREHDFHDRLREYSTKVTSARPTARWTMNIPFALQPRPMITSGWLTVR